MWRIVKCENFDGEKNKIKKIKVVFIIKKKTRSEKNRISRVNIFHSHIWYELDI